MKRFAFYGRVSTEDQQDPESSKSWQLARATQLISSEGQVVVEYFDIGQSRALPWKRRPEAARLLADLKRADRAFDAVVIGEPARAFYGNQFGLTFPVFTHYGIELWVPEVGGAVDPGSDAHDLVMALYGGMSKGERNRIKIRVRSAMASQAAEGRFLGGRPPYGYRLADGGPHPNPGKAANGQRLHYLEPDPATASIVERIFAEYLAGSGIYAIAEALTRDGVPCPSAADPKRNSHRSGIAWSKGAVRAILRNPRYTGREVWNKQRRDETLIDVEDVALGHETKLRWNDVDEWIWSAETTHEPIVDPETFARAQQLAGAGAQRAARRVNRRKNTYVLRGLLRCGACGARMQGNWNHDRAHYRCRVPAEYALANKVDHPPTIYLREDHVLPALDEWIASVFDPANIDATIAALAEAQAPSDADEARVEAARRALDDANEKIDRLVAAIEAGSPADVVGPRLRELRATKLAAEQDLKAARPRSLLDEADIRALIEAVGPIPAVLADADAETKARLYNELGLELTFDATKRLVEVEALPVCVRSCRRGDSYHYPTRPSCRNVPGRCIETGQGPWGAPRVAPARAPLLALWTHTAGHMLRGRHAPSMLHQTVDVDELLAVNARLDAAHPSGPIRKRYRHPPAAPGIVDQALERVAPLQPPDELTHLLLHGGWWPGELWPPETEGYFEEAVRPGSGPAPQIRWISFASTWERDVCSVPLLDHSVSSAPLGLWSTQMLSVSVPAPSLTSLLTAFEVALDVLEQDDWGIEDPTWVDLITAPPQPDPTVGEATYRRQVLLHKQLVPLAATWTSHHPCWVAAEMPMAWTHEPPPSVANALLGTGP